MKHSHLARWGGLFLLALVLNTAYLAAFASATLFYMANVLLHLVLGAIVLGVLLRLAPRRPAVLVLAAGALPAVYLISKGNTTGQRLVLWAHIAISALGLLMLLAWIRRDKAWARLSRLYPAALALLALLPAATYAWQRLLPDPRHRIVNPVLAAASMEEEGAGPSGAFWPSAATTTSSRIPSDYFLDSRLCGECHKDIYEQWKGSAHHFASFNNQFYRKSIEYMQSVQGDTKPSRWCAGCHDHALLFTGRWDRPIQEQIDTPEAQAGLGCVSCHAIEAVQGSAGNGGFLLKYNQLHQLAASRHELVRALDRFLTFLNPKPHRRTFLKPFHRRQTAEFCSSCHKVHLDVPVNNYRWMRGFNDYDSWQASGVSGRGARSFYYPPESLSCGGCHMPLVDSRDPGNIDGKVHSHRFPGANTALPFVNRDEAQLLAVENFLKSGFITVDIFAAAPMEESGRQLQMLRRAENAPRLMSSFAVGEEAEPAGEVLLREVGKVAAPLDSAGFALQPGSAVRVDVVVRTRRIGHFFPGGTVDAFDVWLELEALDADGRHIYWSGRVEDGGRGPVEKGAHFYRSYQLDGAGNPINKRNAFQTRSLLYVRLIPPGAADVAHYRVAIPRDARGPITFRARLNHRKFAHYYTQFAYAGQPKAGQDPGLVSVHHDSREYSFAPANIPPNVSGQIKGEIPNLPIVTLAASEVTIPVAAGSSRPDWKPVVREQDYERWNDWGIGLLLQGDLKGAEYAFKKVTEANPRYADGWLNVARALIQEGETDAAKPYVQKALALDNKLARTHFFKAVIEKAEGDYDAALASLRVAASMYPQDRVVLNQISRILFLKRRYGEAIAAAEQVLRVDPEDLQAHYTLMLCYRGIGDAARAAREEKLFLRFKADEASQSLTARLRQLSPEDNNERQPIHDHESVLLPSAGVPGARMAAGAP